MSVFGVVVIAMAQMAMADARRLIDEDDPPPAVPVAPAAEADEAFALPVAAGPILGCVAGAAPAALVAWGGYELGKQSTSNLGTCSAVDLVSLAMIFCAAGLGPYLAVLGSAAGGVVESILRGRSPVPSALGGGVGCILAGVGPLLVVSGVLGVMLASAAATGVDVGPVLAVTLLAGPPIAALATTVFASALRAGEAPTKPDAARTATRGRPRTVAVMAY